MQQETIEKLKKDYSQMKIKGNSSVIKYIFRFNGKEYPFSGGPQFSGDPGKEKLCESA